MKYTVLFFLLSRATVTEAQNLNVIPTALPFLRIMPDARASALGGSGIATSPDSHSIFWNTAKLAFIPNRFGLSATYTPMINRVVSDIFLFDASGYWKIDSTSAVTASIRDFNYGEVTFTTASGAVLKNLHPNEYTAHFGYARKIAHNLSAGINLGYARSNLRVVYLVTNVPTKPASSLMADLSVFYTHLVKRNSSFKNYNLGVSISNVGNKSSHTDTLSPGDFLPANLGLGSNFNFQFGKDHQLALACDLNKLLVPTPDSTYAYYKESVPEGIFKSFADASGGAHEELQEINVSLGAEYWWRKMIALRTGYFYESKYKGNRQYFCLGAGIKYHIVQFDYSYQINASGSELNNIMRFGLSFDINSFSNSSAKKS